MPRKEFTIGKNATGANDIANACKKLAIPPTALIAKENCQDVFLSKEILLFERSLCDYFYSVKTAKQTKRQTPSSK